MRTATVTQRLNRFPPRFKKTCELIKKLCLNVCLVKFICVIHYLNKRIITKRFMVGYNDRRRINYYNELPINNEIFNRFLGFNDNAPILR